MRAIRAARVVCCDTPESREMEKDARRPRFRRVEATRYICDDQFYVLPPRVVGVDSHRQPDRRLVVLYAHIVGQHPFRCHASLSSQDP